MGGCEDNGDWILQSLTMQDKAHDNRTERNARQDKDKKRQDASRAGLGLGLGLGLGC